MGGNFFSQKENIPGGEVQVGVWQKTILFHVFFFEPFPYLPSASLNFWEVLKFLLFHLLHLVGESKEHGVVGGFQPIFCQLCLLAKPQQTNNCRLWAPPQRRQNYNNKKASLSRRRTLASDV